MRHERSCNSRYRLSPEATTSTNRKTQPKHRRQPLSDLISLCLMWVYLNMRVCEHLVKTKTRKIAEDEMSYASTTDEWRHGQPLDNSTHYLCFTLTSVDMVFPPRVFPFWHISFQYKSQITSFDFRISSSVVSILPAHISFAVQRQGGRKINWVTGPPK